MNPESRRRLKVVGGLTAMTLVGGALAPAHGAAITPEPSGNNNYANEMQQPAQEPNEAQAMEPQEPEPAPQDTSVPNEDSGEGVQQSEPAPAPADQGPPSDPAPASDAAPPPSSENNSPPERNSDRDSKLENPNDRKAREQKEKDDKAKKDQDKRDAKEKKDKADQRDRSRDRRQERQDKTTPVAPQQSKPKSKPAKIHLLPYDPKKDKAPPRNLLYRHPAGEPLSVPGNGPTGDYSALGQNVAGSPTVMENRTSMPGGTRMQFPPIDWNNVPGYQGFDQNRAGPMRTQPGDPGAPPYAPWAESPLAEERPQNVGPFGPLLNSLPQPGDDRGGSWTEKVLKGLGYAGLSTVNDLEALRTGKINVVDIAKGTLLNAARYQTDPAYREALYRRILADPGYYGGLAAMSAIPFGPKGKLTSGAAGKAGKAANAGEDAGKAANAGEDAGKAGNAGDDAGKDAGHKAPDEGAPPAVPDEAAPAPVPDEAAGAPRAGEVPDEAAAVPDEATTAPRAGEVPDEAAAVPDEATTAPRAGEVPDEAAAVPDEATTAPRAGEVPDEAAAVPDEATTAPAPRDPDAPTIRIDKDGKVSVHDPRGVTSEKWVSETRQRESLHTTAGKRYSERDRSREFRPKKRAAAAVLGVAGTAWIAKRLSEKQQPGPNMKPPLKEKEPATTTVPAPTIVPPSTTERPKDERKKSESPKVPQTKKREQPKKSESPKVPQTRKPQPKSPSKASEQTSDRDDRGQSALREPTASAPGQKKTAEKKVREAPKLKEQKRYKLPGVAQPKKYKLPELKVPTGGGIAVR